MGEVKKLGKGRKIILKLLHHTYFGFELEEDVGRKNIGLSQDASPDFLPCFFVYLYFLVKIVKKNLF